MLLFRTEWLSWRKDHVLSIICYLSNGRAQVSNIIILSEESGNNGVFALEEPPQAICQQNGPR